VKLMMPGLPGRRIVLTMLDPYGIASTGIRSLA
jgi:hypothetical protein